MASAEYSSPGVYVREVDSSWYESPKTQSVDVTILGPARKGAVNEPTAVTTVKEFESLFGKPLYNAGLCAVMCLNVASSVKFVRMADATAEAREASIAGERTALSENLVTFANAAAGTIDEQVWTVAVSYADGDPSKTNILFSKGETAVYNSADFSPASEAEAGLVGPFDPSQPSFISETLPLIAEKCGFAEPAISQANIAGLTEGTYTFTAGQDAGEGQEAEPRTVSLAGSYAVPMEGVVVLAYNDPGTVDDREWQAEITDSDSEGFNLSITVPQTGEVLYTSEGSELGKLTIEEGSPRNIEVRDIPNFTATLNLGDPPASVIPSQTAVFTYGNNGWQGDEDGDAETMEPGIAEALESISDREIVTTEIVTAPDLHSPVYHNRMIEIAGSRKDIVVLLDLPRHLSEQEAVDHIQGLNYDYLDPYPSSYAAAYYPWVTVYNSYDSADQMVAPTVALLPAMMREYLTYPRWTAPAGQPRLDLSELISYARTLTQKSRDMLYTGGINPLCNYKNLGNTAMGQKTLLRADRQGRESSLNRLNIRLLINYIKVNVEIISASYLFTAIDQVTMDSWVLNVTKFLDSVKNQRGLYDYRVLMNWNTVTPENLNNNIMPGIIQVKPTRVAEFIPIDIVILNRDADFTE